MIKKSTIANIIFIIVLSYIISPWFFEKRLLFNEILSLAGFLVVIYKRGKTGNDFISRWILFLLTWGIVHMAVSIFRMDNFYFYLRNLVIVYSIFSFYLGYFLFPYLESFINRVFKFLKFYISILLIIPISSFLFERFVMSTLFPVIVKRSPVKWILPALILMNIIYAFSYDSSTSIALAGFYALLLVIPGYRLFRQLLFIAIILFCFFFVSIQSNLSLISEKNFSPYNSIAIYQVINSHPLLSLDGNTTWRLVLWKQVIFDHFPQNIFGLGFGTPVMKYYPNSYIQNTRLVYR